MSDQEHIFSDVGGLADTVRRFAGLPDGYFRALEAALQHVSTIKPRKRRQNATAPNSRGSILKQIEREIAKLDQWQKRAAIETPGGPQRIRGLAGSGKTIALALKAAYLHAQYPDWIIAVTFHSRSLYQQFLDLIRRFCFDQLNDDPNWDNLRILHAWGGRQREGVYTQIARHAGVGARDYLYGRERYGMSQAFGGVCSELLAAVAGQEVEPLYDAILIDEAQDLPVPFFRLVHRFTKEPKRVVWAYDDLQKLSETSMPTLEELFGVDANGDPVVRLGTAEQDIVLPVCYRNPPWTLTVAHAAGLGVYRDGGLVQHFDEPTLWTEIGYQVVDGELQPGQHVVLQRSGNSYPRYFEELLDPNDVVTYHQFADRYEQAAWIARAIESNLKNDQVDFDDILVVLPSAYTARQESGIISDALRDRAIPSHLAGVTSSQDEIFLQDSIALANIHRSKGNEAALIYIVNAQHCLEGPDLITRRNTLFTGITRSRAWVRICGWGPGMETLAAEVRSVVTRGYRLDFRVPTEPELSEMRQIHRELTAGEKEQLQRAERQLRDVIQSIESGSVDIASLPPELRTAVAKYFMSAPEPEYADGE